MTTPKTKILVGTAERSGELRAATLVEHIRKKLGADNVEAYAIGSKEHLSAFGITVPEYFDVRVTQSKAERQDRERPEG